jgi:hypothetical protein
MSNRICDPCETVAHCKQSGCVPLRTHDGGESVDLPIGMEDGGFFDTVDQIVIAARWLLVAFAAVVLGAAGAGYFFGG